LEHKTKILVKGNTKQVGIGIGIGFIVSFFLVARFLLKHAESYIYGIGTWKVQQKYILLLFENNAFISI